MSGEYISPALLEELRELSTSETKVVAAGLVLINQHLLHAIVRTLEQRPLSTAGQAQAMAKFEAALGKMERSIQKKTTGIDNMRRSAAALRLALLGNTSR